MAVRRTPIVADFPGGRTGVEYTEAVDTEIAALWNYVGMPLVTIGGTAVAITAVSAVPLIASPIHGQRFYFTPALTNTGPATINIDSRGAYDIVDGDGDPLLSGELLVGQRTTIELDDTTSPTSFRVISAVAKQHWRTIRKTADQSKTTDQVASDDPILKFHMEANRKYSIRIAIYFTAGASPDIEYGLSGPASPTVVHVSRRSRAPNATAYVVAFEAAYTPTTFISGNDTSTLGEIFFDLIVHNGANAGTFAFQWAQGNSSATATTIRAGSYLQWMVI